MHVLVTVDKARVAEFRSESRAQKGSIFDIK